MAYYSNYEISYKDRGLNLALDEKVVRNLVEITEIISLDSLSYLLSKDGRDASDMLDELFESESISWNQDVRDMTELSRRIPDVLFTLTAYGEEIGDIWRGYFYNGKKQVVNARIEFDPCKLEVK